MMVSLFRCFGEEVEGWAWREGESGVREWG